MTTPETFLQQLCRKADAIEGEGHITAARLMHEAAGEIEQLREAVVVLRSALEQAQEQADPETRHQIDDALARTSAIHLLFGLSP